MTINSSLEAYILKKIKKLEEDLQVHISLKDATYDFGGVQCKVYPEQDYWNKFHRLTGQINILYLCLTAHDNKYDEMNITPQKVRPHRLDLITKKIK